MLSWYIVKRAIPPRGRSEVCCLRLPCFVQRHKHGNQSTSLDILQLLLLYYIVLRPSSVVCLPACHLMPAKTSKAIEIPFALKTRISPGKDLLRITDSIRRILYCVHSTQYSHLVEIENVYLNLDLAWISFGPAEMLGIWETNQPTTIYGSESTIRYFLTDARMSPRSKIKNAPLIRRIAGFYLLGFLLCLHIKIFLKLV